MGDIATEGMNSPTVNKLENQDHGESSSVGSTPEAEGIEQDNAQLQEPGQLPQKRKGGRKPIYATSEERKQRNRQAQAAFRERRTEYIKQLESTIKVHEDNLQSLQQSHRSAADECLMLRYKNSLLERVLLEKGIDVQAELRAKGGSPNLGPSRMPTSAAPLSQPIQRYAVNKYAQNRRSLTGMSVKTDRVSPTQAANISPHIQPTPASRISSPTTSTHRSPNFLPQTGPMSPSFGPVSQQLRPQQHQLRPQQFQAPQRPPMPTSNYSNSASTINSGMSASSSARPNNPNQQQNGNGYYPSTFQSHYDQLDEEYDATDDMYDDQDPGEGPTGAGAAAAYGQPGFQMPAQGLPQQLPPGNHQPQHMNGSNAPLQVQPSPIQAPEGNSAFGASLNHGYDPYDPMLDADPFGLSASMHFPTQFSFDASSAR